MVKVTSGKYRGRELVTPGEGTHPMGAREKLALFNMIAEFLPGANVLDAYAGSGALGIEALSRGAEYVIFVEKNPRAARVIQANLEKLGLLESAWVAEWDVKNFLPPKEFEVILADPPYDNFQIRDVAGLVKFLKAEGVFVLSHPGEAPAIERLELVKSREYAAARVSIYRKMRD